ncbi:MAG TPA: DUF5652 family protein [Candidatus Paceibacterota bacterium]|nr:DUF5652 family protein [Candidatus Paceibacterota bacterium]
MHDETIIFIVIFLLSFWTLIWKIFSVWTAARNGDRGWFVALLLLNTLSILDIWYLFKVAKVSKERVSQVFKRPIKKLFEKSVATTRSENQKEEEHIDFKI